MRDGDTEASAEIFGCGMYGELMDGRPQVELAAGGVTLEAAVAMSRQIDPEVAALATAGLVYRARAAEPMAVAATGDEAQERQNLLDRDLRSELGKVDGWHDRRIRHLRPDREEDRVINPWSSAAVSIWAFRRPGACWAAGHDGHGTSGPRSSTRSRRPPSDRGWPWPAGRRRGNRPTPRS